MSFTPTFGATVVSFCYGMLNPRCLIHPSAYSQGQCALFAFTHAIDSAEFLAMNAMAQARYRQEIRHLQQLFHVSTK